MNTYQKVVNYVGSSKKNYIKEFILFNVTWIAFILNQKLDDLLF
jgi:hypothetical protein